MVLYNHIYFIDACLGGIQMRNYFFILIGIGVVLLSFFLNFFNSLDVIKSIFVQTTWWIYFVLAGIIYSGYRAAIHIQADKKVDQAFIEEEGERYIKRINEEKEKRKASSRN
jgi:hypothetical protein